MTVLRDDEVSAALAGLPGWAVEGGALVRAFTFEGGFMPGIAFVNRVAAAAERVDHHPDIDIRWNVVTLRLCTHSEGGITAKDVAMARDCDALVAP